MLNFLGVGQNFSVLAETQWETTFLFRDEVTGEGASLDAVTFEGWVMVQGSKHDIRFTRAPADSMGYMVMVSLPALPEGRWEYEIFCVAETGEKMRLLNGFVAAVGGLDADGGTTYEHRTLEVRLPGDATRRLLLEWQATTVAQQAADAAKAALAEVKQVEGKMDDALQAAEDAEQFAQEAEAARDEAREIVDNAPREFLPDISEDGYWIVNGVKTAYRAVPVDGVNGADAVTVVRHRIADVSELPTEGETCSGGHLYYIQKPDVPASARLTLREGVTLADLPELLELVVNGTSVRASTETLLTIDGVPGLLLNVLTEVFEGLTGEVRDGALFLSTEADTLTVDAEAQGVLEVEETPRHRWDYCPCYAWCEDAQGVGEWVLINADGMSTAGTGDGGNGFGGSLLREATTIRLGGVRMGTDEVYAELDDLRPVGKDAQGRMCVRLMLPIATFTQMGIVKLGSQFNVKNLIPYLLSITADSDGQLCQNLAAGGALKHQQREGWEACASPGVDTASMQGSDFYMGLHTSNSFKQSEEKGLELELATGSQPGGVLLTNDIDETEPARVLDAGALKALLSMSYATKRYVLDAFNQCIQTNATLMSIKVLTQAQYDALTQIDAHTLYLVY